MNKKAIAILGAIFVLIVGTLGFLIYSKYGGKKAPAATAPPAENNTLTGNENVATSTPPITSPSPAAIKLTDDQVVSPVLYYDGTGIAYFNNQGQSFQSNLEESNGLLQLARKKMLDIPIKTNINKIYWPSTGKNFIAEISDSSGKKFFSFYDGEKGTYTDLPPQVFSLDWLPSGKRILYVWLENNKATMTEGDGDGQNWKSISEMWEPDDILKVSPDGKNVLYYEANSPGNVNFINQTTPDGKIWKGLIKDGYNYGVLWSPDSNKFLFNKKNSSGQGFQLWYYDLLSGDVRNTGILTTVDKAVWNKDGNAFYAAVPVTGAAGEGALTVDNFYKIDISDFNQKQFQTGSTNVDGRDMFLSLDETKLFFKNAQDGALYYLDLNQ